VKQFTFEIKTDKLRVYFAMHVALLMIDKLNVS